MRRPAHRGGARVSLKPRIAGAIAVTAVIAGCGGGHATKPSSDASVGTPVPHSTSALPTTPITPHPPAASPELVRLRASLTGLLRKAGPDSGAVVYDLTAKQTLFALRPN